VALVNTGAAELLLDVLEATATVAVNSEDGGEAAVGDNGRSF